MPLFPSCQSHFIIDNEQISAPPTILLLQQYRFDSALTTYRTLQKNEKKSKPMAASRRALLIVATSESLTHCVVGIDSATNASLDQIRSAFDGLIAR
jgi:hypothetical protein